MTKPAVMLRHCLDADSMPVSREKAAKLLRRFRKAGAAYFVRCGVTRLALEPFAWATVYRAEAK